MRDLINQTFGKLTVIEKTNLRDSSQRIIWRCICECGEERLVNTSALTGNQITACETCSKNKGNEKRKNTLSNQKIRNDLTGQRFNRLLVLEPTDKRANDRCIIWKCQCDCGNIVEVSSKSLKQNNTKSCGCLNTETRMALGHDNKIDLTGMIFGRLTVIEDSGKRSNNNVLWRCQCECGAQPLIKGNSLRSGVSSCGCLLSKGEAAISKLLTENNIPFEVQKTFDDCVFTDSNRKARFDFWVNNKYLIEYDGQQHFEANPSPKSWNTEANLIETQKRDKIKNDWCVNNNIVLIRIPYTKLETLTIEDLLLETTQFKITENQ